MKLCWHSSDGNLALFMQDPYPVSRNEYTMKMFHIIWYIISIDDEEEWDQYTSLWDSKGDVTLFGACITILDKLPYICEIISEPPINMQHGPAQPSFLQLTKFNCSVI